MSDLNDRERIERANQARAALQQFLDPAFAAVIDAYSERLEAIASLTPWEAGKITALANAIRIAKEVRGQIAAFVADGQGAERNVIRVDRIEKLTPAKRRLLQIGAI